MPFLLVHLLNHDLQTRFNKYLKKNPELFCIKMSPSCYLLNNNEIAMTYIVNHMIRHKGNIDVYLVEPLELKDFPKESQKIGEWMNQKEGRSIKDGIRWLNEKENQTNNLQKKLEKMRFSIDWKLISS